MNSIVKSLLEKIGTDSLEKNMLSYFTYSSQEKVHIAIIALDDEEVVLCGRSKVSSVKTETPKYVRDVCIQCTQGKYNMSYYYDKNWDPADFLEFLGLYQQLGFNPKEHIERQEEHYYRNLEYFTPYQNSFSFTDYIEHAMRIKDQLNNCNHTYLVSLLRSNGLDALKCHVCSELIYIIDCQCVSPLPIEIETIDREGIDDLDQICGLCQRFIIISANQFV